MKTFSMLFLLLFILLSAFILDTAFAQPVMLDLQLNDRNAIGEPNISAKNTQQNMQSVLQNSGKDIIFIENLGQIRDSEGKKRPDVLFLTRSQGVDMYVEVKRE